MIVLKVIHSGLLTSYTTTLVQNILYKTSKARKWTCLIETFYFFVWLKIERWLCSFEEEDWKLGKECVAYSCRSCRLELDLYIRWTREEWKQETPLNATTSIKVTKSIREKYDNIFMSCFVQDVSIVIFFSPVR